MVSRRVFTNFLLAPLLASGARPVNALTAIETDHRTLRGRRGRTVEVHIWRPAQATRGRVHFFHGAYSAPWKYTALLEPLCALGFEIHAPLHVDSTDHPLTHEYGGLRSWSARLEDAALLSAQTEDRYHAIGHSYGGLLALTLGGATPVLPKDLTTAPQDARVERVVALSPPPPVPGLIDAPGYSSLRAPALIQTGDRDWVPGLPGNGWQDHLIPFEAATASGSHYALVLEGVDHYFGNAICRPELPGPPQSAQLAAALRVIDAFLADDQQRLRSMLSDRGPVRLQNK